MKTALTALFTDIFGPPEKLRCFAAPGRVNLMGEHTDYHRGYVLPCPISLGTWGAAQPREDDLVRLYSANFPSSGVVQFSLKDLVRRPEDGWANYPKGVLWAFGQRGYSLPHGFDAVIRGDLPPGAGLSSSASLEILTGLMLRDLYALPLEGDSGALAMAKIAQEAENRFMGVQSGIMDQCAIALGRSGGALFLHCGTLKYRWVPVNLEEWSLLILDSGKSRELASSAYNQRREECDAALDILQKGGLEAEHLGEISLSDWPRCESLLTDPLLRRRVRHVLRENHRTQQAAAILEQGDLKAFGALMNQCHLSLQFDYQVSCPELDCLAASCWHHPGCAGARMTGAGFGGCAVALVQREKTESFRRDVTERYALHMERECTIHEVTIPEGAHTL